MMEWFGLAQERFERENAQVPPRLDALSVIFF